LNAARTESAVCTSSKPEAGQKTSAAAAAAAQSPAPDATPLTAETSLVTGCGVAVSPLSP
jgi:hypothetical protein